MVDATGLCGVVGDCAAGSAELVVELDTGGECEEAVAIRAQRLWAVRAPWRSRLKRSLQVTKTDSIRCRIGAS